MVGGSARWPRAEKETLGDFTEVDAVGLFESRFNKTSVASPTGFFARSNSQNKKGAGCCRAFE
jgi:hypothetical protein